MIKFFIPAAVLVSTIAVAAPASAQWAPPMAQGYGYGQQDNRGVIRSFEVRLNRLHQNIHRLGERRQLSRNEFSRLNRQVDVIESRLRRASYGRLNRQEAYVIQRDIARLEQNIYREARDGNGYRDHHSQGQYAYGNQNGYNAYDRDRDGRDDRYEDDRGRDHDGRDDHDND